MYEYGFARRANFALEVTCEYEVRLCAQSDLLRTDEYGFACKATYALEATYAYKVRIFQVQQLILQGHS